MAKKHVRTGKVAAAVTRAWEEGEKFRGMIFELRQLADTINGYGATLRSARKERKSHLSAGRRKILLRQKKTIEHKRAELIEEMRKLANKAEKRFAELKKGFANALGAIFPRK